MSSTSRCRFGGRRSWWFTLTLATAILTLVVSGLSGQANAAGVEGTPSSAGAPSAAGAVVSVPPARIMDTRINQGVTGSVPALGTVSLQVTGRGGVPVSGVSAVVVNVTAVSPAGSGFITVWPSGTGRPGVSNLNFRAGQIVPNLVVVPVGADGKIELFNGSAGTVDLLADVAGYTLAGAPSAAGAVVSVPPARIMDTRINQGVTGSVPALGTVSLQVTGRGGVPVSGVSAVVVNVTAVSPAGSGFITVWPSGTGRPGVSNLNFRAGQIVPNLVVVPVGADGKIELFNGSAGTVDLLADVAGYTLAGAPSAAGAVVSVPPARIMDTRINQGVTGPVPALGTVSLQVTGRGGVPVSGVSAVVVNVTAVSPAGSGFITVWPSGTGRPGVSNLNFRAGQIVPNLVVVPVGADGKIELFNGSAGTVDLLADVAGYTLAGAPSAAGAVVSVPPARIMDTRINQGVTGPVPALGTVSLQVTGRGGVPVSGVSAVVVNVTAVSPAGSGFITVWPSGTGRPGVSNLNFRAGQIVPNLVVVPVGADGKIELFNGSAGTVDLLADVA